MSKKQNNSVAVLIGLIQAIIVACIASTISALVAIHLS